MMMLASLSPAVADWIAALWLLALGAAVGSFLNVVIYRLPAGLSLITPGSHCPACKHPIRWYDNIPVLSWILLRARCRDCGASISSRYPIIEAATAVLFVVVAASEAHLLVRAGEAAAGWIWPTFATWAAVELYVYHVVLLCTLLAAAVIEYDTLSVPATLLAPAFVIGLAAPLAWPHVHPILLTHMGMASRAVALGDGLAGLAIGALFGCAQCGEITAKGRVSEILAPACVGLFLGFLPAVMVTGAPIVLRAAAESVGRIWPALRRIPPTAWLAAVTLGWIVTGPWIIG